MNKLFLLVFILLTSLCAFAERIERKDFVSSRSTVIDMYYDKEIEIGKGIKFRALIEVTSKGNGLLKIANLDLGVYDEHCDVAYYENGLLDVDFIDINKDGYKDIIVSGLVCYIHEEQDIILRREPVVFIYTFSLEKKKFFLSYRNASFKLEDGIGASGVYGHPVVVDNFIKEGRKQAQEENNKRIMEKTTVTGQYTIP